MVVGARLFSNFTRRQLFVVATCLVALIGILTAVFGLPLIKCRSTDHLYIHEVMIVDQPVHEMAAAAINAGKYPAVTEDFGTFSQDKLRTGGGSVLAMRTRISKPFSLTTDDTDYESVTIIFPGDVSRGGNYEIGPPWERNSVWAIYAAGSAHYPDHACFGYASGGEISVDPVSDRFIRVSLTLRFDGVRLYAHKLRPCGQELKTMRSEFQEMTLVEFEQVRQVQGTCP